MPFKDRRRLDWFYKDNHIWHSSCNWREYLAEFAVVQDLPWSWEQLGNYLEIWLETTNTMSFGFLRVTFISAVPQDGVLFLIYSLHWGKVSFRVFNLASRTLIVLPPQATKPKGELCQLSNMSILIIYPGVNKVAIGWVCGPSGLMGTRPGPGHHFLPVNVPHSNGEGWQ